MTRPRAAIILASGYTQPDYWNESCGLWALRDRIGELYNDRRDMWVGIRTWDGSLNYDADEIHRLNPHHIIFIGYSWGCGKGLHKFANRASEIGREIDLAITIDPVPQCRTLSRAGRAWRCIPVMGSSSCPRT